MTLAVLGLVCLGELAVSATPDEIVVGHEYVRELPKKSEVAAGLGPEVYWIGSWEGEVGFPRRPVVVTVKLAWAEGDLLRGEIVLPGGARPLQLLSLAGDEVTFGVPDPDGPNEVTLVREGERIRGTWRGPEGGPVLLRRLPEPTSSPTREQAWDEDLDALEHRFLAYDHSFSPAARARFGAATAALHRDLPRLDDAQVVTGMARAIALAGNAHTRLYLVRNRTEVRRLPVRLWSFRDGWRVVAARPEHASLLGARVVAVGGRPVAAAEAAVAPLYAGNRSWRRYMAAYTLTSPETLRGAGVLPEAGPVALTVELPAGRRTVVLEPMPLARSKEPLEAWWDLAPREGWVSALAEPGRSPPALRDPSTRYLLEPLQGGRVLYLRYNRAGDQPGAETVETFGAGVLRAITPLVKLVVVDLRYNTGGDLGVARALFDKLVERVKGQARLVVLTGRATFSAGLFHAAQLRLAGARLVGEPAGDRLDYWSEGGNVILPHSGLAAHYANAYHAYSQAPLPPGLTPYLDVDVAGLAPDEVVEPNFADWRAGRDPVLEAALRLR